MPLPPKNNSFASTNYVMELEHSPKRQPLFFAACDAWPTPRTKARTILRASAASPTLHSQCREAHQSPCHSLGCDIVPPSAWQETQVANLTSGCDRQASLFSRKSLHPMKVPGGTIPKRSGKMWGCGSKCPVTSLHHRWLSLIICQHCGFCSWDGLWDF